MIGDTAYDMAMARAAGCRALGVAWGYHAAGRTVRGGGRSGGPNPAELEELIDARTR